MVGSIKLILQEKEGTEVSLKDIVNVQIRINTPAKNSQSFNAINLVGPGPDGQGAETPPRIFPITSVDDLIDLGYTTAHPTYDAALIAFSQTPQPAVVYITTREENVGVPEPIGDCMADALAINNNWYGWALTAPEDDYDIVDSIAWNESHTLLYGFDRSTKTLPTGMYENTTFLRSHGWYSPTNTYLSVAAMANCFSYTPGNETWALKTLYGCSIDTLSAADILTIEGLKLNYFQQYASTGVTQTGTVIGGEWIDVIRFRDWLENDMQLRIFNLLKTNPKIPYTNRGISMVKTAMIASLKQGVKQQGISEDEYDSEGVLVPGFTVSVPNVFDITGADKAARVLNNCVFNATLAGAIQAVNINGSLNY
jgi:hypothetical protein